MAQDGPLPTGVGGKRRRDTTGYVVMRRPRPVIVGRASQADVDAEAFARFVGSWGNFSAHIGHRWELLAGEEAGRLLGRQLGAESAVYTLGHVEELDRNEALHREVERVGVSCPDALFCGRDAVGRSVVQPVDYKMSLDTAGFDQVEAERILDLATRGGDLTVAAIWSALSRVADVPLAAGDDRRVALLAGLATGAVRPVDGLFVAPDTAFNRSHLRSQANRQRQRPLTVADVLLVAATPERCFGGLPGWEEAQVLLRADRVRADLPGDLGMAERYARLGAGVRGALQTIHAPLFGQTSELDGAGELQRLLAGHPSSLDVLRLLQERRAARLEVLRRRDALLRFPFRMPVLAEALGTAPDAGWPDDLLRTGIAALHTAHRERVAAAGLALLTAGLDDLAVLEGLEVDWPAFKRAARREIQRWAHTARAGAPPAAGDGGSGAP